MTDHASDPPECRANAAALPDLPVSGHSLIETLKPQKVKIGGI